MSIISGNVYYTPNNVLTPTIGIPNVPVVLRDPVGLVGAVALTDSNGTFVFNNVPNGSYQVIEAWGTAGGTPTPVDYLASLIPMAVMPTEAEPPLSALPVAPPALADMLMAISPNLLNITVTGDVTALAFYDGPVGSKPVVFNGIQMIGPNLITAADNGSFGTVAPGSPVNTIPAVAPYPTATPGLPYQAAPEILDGRYSIVNIRRQVNTQFAWWNLSDHETMLETGRFMFVNGDQPGSILFTNTVSVTPNTFYTFTNWGLNLLNTTGLPPRFSVKIIGSDGSTLGYQVFNNIAVTPIPVWYQGGFLFNSGAFSSVTVEVLSEAPGGPGNDYAIDELRLFQSDLIDLLSLEKSMTPSTIYSATSGAGQDVTVTVVVTNTSNITAPNVIFKDVIDPQLQFVPGSVQVNGSGVGFGTADPNVGFSLGNMAAGAVNTVTFHVTTLAAGPVTIANTATASYDAATNGNGDVITNTVNSNTANLEIIINKADVAMNKTADKAFANIGEIITYTLTLTNNGNVPANAVTINDPVPNGTTFVPGSVTGATGIPPTLTLFAPIAPGGSAVVTFKVQVGTTIPVPNPISNSALAAYKFTIDPAQPDGGSGTAQSGPATTQVNAAILTTTKAASAAYAETDQIVTYTLTIHNSGSVAANNVIINDPIPADTTFVIGSVTGATGTPPILTVASIPAGATAVVTFQVKVSSTIPLVNPIVNEADVAFTYTVDPAQPNAASGTAPSNAVATQVNDANITTVLAVDKTVSDIGEVLTYTITLTNTGNVPANNVTINAPDPSGTTFINGSLIGATGTPPTLTLPASIPPGGSTVVTYQVLVGNAIPAPNPIPQTVNTNFTFTMDPASPNGQNGTSGSNTVHTLVNSAIIETVKKADLVYANVGDTITYTITVTNSGNVAANNVVLTDALPAGVSFVAGSLTGATGTPPTLTLNSPVPAGSSAVVTYQVLVGAVVPNPNPVKNSASAAFTYTVDSAKPNGASGTSYSNATETQVNTAKLVMQKSADKLLTYIGDTLTYQISVKNTGNVAADYVVLTDLLPTGVSYVPGSLVVSVPYSGTLAAGLLLTNPIAAGQTVTLTFQTKVDSMPNPNPIANKATAAYAYTVDPAAPDAVTGTAASGTVNTIVLRHNFGQQISDLIESVALEQEALAAIANAEGAKIQRMASMPGVSTQELLCLNRSVSDMMDSIALLEAVLKQKLSIVSCQVDGNAC